MNRIFKKWSIIVSISLSLFVCAVMSFSVTADNPTRFVALNGSDEKGDGSLNNPFRTLERATESVDPGTIIYVRGGHYHSAQEIIQVQGTSNNYITIQPYENETVIFDGIGSDIELFESIILITNSKYLIFQGFELQNSTGRGLSVYESSYVEFRDNTIHHIEQRGLGGGGDHLSFVGNKIYQVVWENKFEAMRVGGGWSSALRTAKRRDGSPSSNILIKDNKIYKVWGEGINALFVTDIVIEGNEVYDAYGVNIYLDHAKNVTLRNNQLYAEDSTFFRSEYYNRPAHAIGLANETYTDPTETQINNVLIEGNEIRGTATAVRFWHDKGNLNRQNTYWDVTIRNNKISSTTEKPIKFDYVSLDYRFPKGYVSDNIFQNLPEESEYVLGNPMAWNVSNGVVMDNQIYMPIVIE